MAPNDRNDEAVLEHVAWVQRLAFRLCADAALAEDVTQESLLSAFRAPPRRGPALRHWLVGVVRNQVRMAQRAASRRQRREADARTPDEVASPAELVERAANHRVVVEAVTALPEIYRTALLRRYFDDLSPRRIAELESLPEATIKTRLRRGLEMLREQLAERLGDERDPDTGARAWIVALVPMAGVELRRRGAAAAGVGAGSIAAWAGLVALLVLACWLGAAWWSGVGAPQFAGFEPAASHEPRASTGQQESPRSDRRLARDGALVEQQVDAEVTNGARVRVQAEVRDADGQPVGDVALAVRPFADQGRNESERAARSVGRCGAQGSCAFEVAPELLQLVVDAPGWVTVVPGTIFPYAASTEVRVVAARRRVIVGTVTDVDGGPISSAEVCYSAASLVAARIGQPVDLASRRRWTTRSDAVGAFRLEVPELPGARLRVHAWHHESATVELAANGDQVVGCVLPPRRAASTWLQGRVRTAAGEVAATATVAVGAQAVRCDERGRFRLDVGSEPAGATLWVVAPGHRPTPVAMPAPGARDGLELRLGPAPLVANGRVVDEAGRPRAGVRVDVSQPCARAFLRSPDGERTRAVPLEHLSSGRVTAVTTDANGWFSLGGLADRRYRLLVRDPATLAIAVVDVPALPASGLELRLPSPDGSVRVAGTVVDDRDQPLRGVPVTAIVTAADGASVQAGCRTDAQGRFRFARPLPPHAVLRVAAGADHAPLDVPLADRAGGHAARDALRLVLPRAGSFYLRRGDPEGPPVDGFRLESPDGRAVRLLRVEGQVCFTIDGGTLEAGRSPVVRAPAGLHLLVLLRGGREVRRQPLQLRPGPTVRIDF